MPTLPLTEEQLRTIAVIIPVAVAIIPLSQFVFNMFTYFQQRARRSLRYKLHTSPLLAITPKNATLEVVVNGTRATNVSVVILFLTNSGRKAITVDDFQNKQPIRISFSGNATVLSADVKYRNVNALPLLADITRQTIAIEPTLIEPGEDIDLVCLVQDYSSVRIAARILDIKEIQGEEIGLEHSENIMHISAVGMLVFSLAIILLISRETTAAVFLILLGWLLEIPLRLATKRLR